MGTSAYVYVGICVWLRAACRCIFVLYVAAERVKVFVRIRPTKAEGETSGGLRPKADGNGVVIEAFRPEGGDFVSEGIVLEDDVQGSASGTDVESYSVQKPPRKFLDVGFKSGNKVFQIRRYDTTKLKPAPAP